MSDRELDAKVAELMGWYYIREDEDDIDSDGYWTHPSDRSGNSSPPDYPGDIAAAMQVAEKVDLFVHYQLCKSWNGSKWLITKLHKDLDDAEECWLDTFVAAPTAAEAICRAAVLAAEAGK